MIPIIGIMVGLYIIARMVETIARELNASRSLVIAFAALALLGAIGGSLILALPSGRDSATDLTPFEQLIESGR